MVSTDRLLRALARSASAHGLAAELTLAATRDWASALFVGERCTVSVGLDAGEPGERWLAALPDLDLPMVRQFAREVLVTHRESADGRIAATIEALVLEE